MKKEFLGFITPEKMITPEMMKAAVPTAEQTYEDADTVIKIKCNREIDHITVCFKED